MAGHRILAVIWKNDPFKILLYTCRHLINQNFYLIRQIAGY